MELGKNDEVWYSTRGRKHDGSIPIYLKLGWNGTVDETKDMVVMKSRRKATKHCTRACGYMTMHVDRRKENNGGRKKRYAGWYGIEGTLIRALELIATESFFPLLLIPREFPVSWREQMRWWYEYEGRKQTTLFWENIVPEDLEQQAMSQFHQLGRDMLVLEEKKKKKKKKIHSNLVHRTIVMVFWRQKTAKIDFPKGRKKNTSRFSLER
jgi:hypothetical protein